MSETIYVVTEGCYSSYHICAVFSTKEKAQDFINKKKDLYYDASIEDYPLDAFDNYVRAQAWKATIHVGDGALKEWKDEPVFIEKGTTTGPVKQTSALSGFNITVTSYVSKDHAKKLAVEARQARLRGFTDYGPMKSAVVEKVTDAPVATSPEIV
jgi:hypothetical protein